MDELRVRRFFRRWRRVLFGPSLEDRVLDAMAGANGPVSPQYVAGQLRGPRGGSRHSLPAVTRAFTRLAEKGEIVVGGRATVGYPGGIIPKECLRYAPA